ncbi:MULTISPECIES: glycerate kinase [unclassified Microbacterium]|uniref:glycerate kinase n=1 Tax=Microbacterium TaxID=33882 RepID=UPI003B9E1A35
MTRLRVLIAPDKFKGCLDAAQVADAVASGFPPERFDVRRMPFADGGDGSVAAAAFGGARTLALVVRPGAWESTRSTRSAR